MAFHPCLRETSYRKNYDDEIVSLASSRVHNVWWWKELSLRLLILLFFATGGSLFVDEESVRDL